MRGVLLLNKMFFSRTLTTLGGLVSIRLSVICSFTLIPNSLIVMLVVLLTDTPFIFTFIVFMPMLWPVLVPQTYTLKVTFLSEMPHLLIIAYFISFTKAIPMISVITWRIQQMIVVVFVVILSFGSMLK